VGYLLANKACVVSESSADAASMDVVSGGGLVAAPYEELVERRCAS
jgi:hypothetical protein